MLSVALFATTVLLRSACVAPIVAMRDTLPVARDTVHVDTVPPIEFASDTASSARIAFDFGSGIGAAMAARSLELGVSTAPNPYLRNQSVATTRLRFVRRPDSLSAEFARRVASNVRIPFVEVEIRTGSGAPVLFVRLHDVQVVSTRLAAGSDAAALRQQWLALTESIEQVRADRDEAERQLTVTASLAKRKLASPVELDRARDAAALLRARLDVQQRRLALIDRQLSEWMPFEEEIILAAVSMDAETKAPR
jgi:hypothetical protein